MTGTTQFLDVDHGKIAYDATGDGQLVVLVPGMGQTRASFRLLAPKLLAGGYRVATLDVRGLGESSTGWSTYTRTDTANDVLALVEHLGGPALVVGHSFAGGSATIAAAKAPGLITGIVELCPFTRVQKPHLGALFTNARFRKGARLLMTTALTGSTRVWARYLDHAYPGIKPADYAEDLALVQANLAEPGRMAAARKMGMSAPKDAGVELGNIRCPALVVMGTLDPDWPHPEVEAEAIVAAMPSGLGRVAMVDGAGHYPHVQFPDQVAQLMLSFFQEIVRA